jgi:peptidoglycan/xylan/chitin deacetylase (PgdA/CDA1 family)
MITQVIRGLRDGVKTFAHVAGGLAAYHRVRNHRWLTSLVFHRVLPQSDPRFYESDPEWTITVDQLVDSVRFVKRHFNVVSLDEILDARRRRKRLPPRPLLLTLDDGWSDNEEYALPVFEAEKVPGVIFVTSDVVGKSAPLWFEVIRAARIGGRIDAQTWSGLWASVNEPTPTHWRPRHVEELIHHLSNLPRVRRDAILEPFRSRLEDGRRHMVTPEQLERLHAKGITVGAHGRTHQPLHECEDLEDELREPRRRLEALLARPVTTLALPHSRSSPEVVQRAEAAGYELVFTGVRGMTPTHRIPFTIGRAAITPEGLAGTGGRMRPERLALYLFRGRHLARNAQA